MWRDTRCGCRPFTSVFFAPAAQSATATKRRRVVHVDSDSEEEKYDFIGGGQQKEEGSSKRFAGTLASLSSSMGAASTPSAKLVHPRPSDWLPVIMVAPNHLRQLDTWEEIEDRPKLLMAIKMQAMKASMSVYSKRAPPGRVFSDRPLSTRPGGALLL